MIVAHPGNEYVANVANIIRQEGGTTYGEIFDHVDRIFGKMGVSPSGHPIQISAVEVSNPVQREIVEGAIKRAASGVGLQHQLTALRTAQRIIAAG